jgi:hypothetical protein
MTFFANTLIPWIICKTIDSVWTWLTLKYFLQLHFNPTDINYDNNIWGCLLRLEISSSYLCMINKHMEWQLVDCPDSNFECIPSIPYWHGIRYDMSCLKCLKEFPRSVRETFATSDTELHLPGPENVIQLLNVWNKQSACVGPCPSVLHSQFHPYSSCSAIWSEFEIWVNWAKYAKTCPAVTAIFAFSMAMQTCVSTYSTWRTLKFIYQSRVHVTSGSVRFP